jgi:two-component system chemotaxis response regulator CheY
MEKEKRKILIVDDDHFLLDMYALKFSQNDFEVHTNESAVDAIKKMKEGLAPDIVLTDIIMPEMDGFEFLEHMNTSKLSPKSIKIILTNKSEQADIEKGNSLGAAGYIVKANSTPLEVINQVIDILNKKTLVMPN